MTIREFIKWVGFRECSNFVTNWDRKDKTNFFMCVYVCRFNFINEIYVAFWTNVVIIFVSWINETVFLKIQSKCDVKFRPTATVCVKWIYKYKTNKRSTYKRLSLSCSELKETLFNECCTAVYYHIKQFLYFRFEIICIHKAISLKNIFSKSLLILVWNCTEKI